MLLLGCSQCILLLLSCSELLNSQWIRPLEQLGRKKKKKKNQQTAHNLLSKLPTRFCEFNRPAAESCSQTIQLESLKSPPESDYQHSQTVRTPHQLAAPYRPCSGPPGSGNPQLGPCFGRGSAVGEHEGGGAAPSSPNLSDWDPSSPQPQWEKLDGFQELG